MFDYNDDVLSFNNCGDRIYPIEPEIKDTTDTEALAHIIFLSADHKSFNILPNGEPDDFSSQY
jgi:hypothetical protein